MNDFALALPAWPACSRGLIRRLFWLFFVREGIVGAVNEPDISALRRRWFSLGGVGDAPRFESCWAAFQVAYGSPDHAYHNFRHIEDCLRQLDRHKELACDPMALEFAVWFHDLVDERFDKDGVSKSAEAARSFLEPAGTAFSEKVRALVLATDYGAGATGFTADQELLRDIDLSILARGPAEYAEYAASIRAEYNFVSEPEFRAGRARVLKSFLGMAWIFRTAAFRELHESAARMNLREELGRLESGRD